MATQAISQHCITRASLEKLCAEKWNYDLTLSISQIIRSKVVPFHYSGLYDVSLLSTSASLNSRTPWLPPTRWVGWVSWFLMRLISDRILWTLAIISLFPRSRRLPGATHKFLVVLVPTFGNHLSVVNCRFYFSKFCKLNVHKTMSDFLKIARCYRERRGTSWYRKEVIRMNVIDFFCRGTLIFPLQLCLAV